MESDEKLPNQKKKKKIVVIKSAEWYVVQCSEENKNSAVKKIKIVQCSAVKKTKQC